MGQKGTYVCFARGFIYTKKIGRYIDLKVRKSVIFYIAVILIYLSPSRLAHCYMPYSSYLFSILQCALGIYWIRKFPSFHKNRIILLLTLFLLSGLPGMIYVYHFDFLAIGRYSLKIISIIGLFQFFCFESDEARQDFFESSRVVFVVTYVLTIIYGLNINEQTAYGEGVFFWGSKAVTTHAFIALFALSSFYDLRYKGKISLFTYAEYALSLTFCFMRTSGQGVTMFLVIALLFVLNNIFKKQLWEIIPPPVVIIVLGILYYVVITMRFQDIEFVVQYITGVLSKETTLSGRDAIFSGCLEIFSHHPWIGYGYDNAIVNDILGQRFMQFNSAHNSMLQMLIDYGIIGMSIFVLLMYNAFKEMAFTGDHETEMLYIVVIAMFIGGLVNMIIPTNYFWMVVLLGCSEDIIKRFDTQFKEIVDKRQ